MKKQKLSTCRVRGLENADRLSCEDFDCEPHPGPSGLGISTLSVLNMWPRGQQHRRRRGAVRNAARHCLPGVFIPAVLSFRPKAKRITRAVLNLWNARGHCKNPRGEKDFRIAHCTRPTMHCCTKACEPIEAEIMKRPTYKRTDLKSHYRVTFHYFIHASCCFPRMSIINTELNKYISAWKKKCSTSGPIPDLLDPNLPANRLLRAAHAQTPEQAPGGGRHCPWPSRGSAA